jgi:hypothetical protein
MPATDTRGGIVIAWVSNLVQLDNAHIDVNNVNMGETSWWGAGVVVDVRLRTAGRC